MDFFEKYCMQTVPFDDCSYFISAGHTARDFETLIEAFRGLDYKLKIFCTLNSIPNVKDLPDNVDLSWNATYYDLVAWYKKSIAILIPLKYPKKQEGCQGMTSLQDVVTFGKPVIMTKNPTLNLDVEKEGFGFYVDMYDVEGWREKLTLLHNNEELWNKMSGKSSYVFKHKFNSRIFSDHLESVLEKVYHESGAANKNRKTRERTMANL
jgi:glycosyltransferase involved in cell wall biosynthesis